MKKELNNELYEIISRGSYSWGVYDYFKENVGGHTDCDDLIDLNPKLLIYIMAKQINKLSREIDQIRRHVS